MRIVAPYSTPGPCKAMGASNAVLVLVLLLSSSVEMGNGFAPLFFSSVPRDRRVADGGVSAGFDFSAPSVFAAAVGRPPCRRATPTVSMAPPSHDETASSSLREEAEPLKARAKQLREEIETGQRLDGLASSSPALHPGRPEGAATTAVPPPRAAASPWTVAPSPAGVDDGSTGEGGDGYRLYVDVGREDPNPNCDINTNVQA